MLLAMEICRLPPSEILSGWEGTVEITDRDGYWAETTGPPKYFPVVRDPANKKLIGAKHESLALWSGHKGFLRAKKWSDWNKASSLTLSSADIVERKISFVYAMKNAPPNWDAEPLDNAKKYAHFVILISEEEERKHHYGLFTIESVSNVLDFVFDGESGKCVTCVLSAAKSRGPDELALLLSLPPPAKRGKISFRDPSKEIPRVKLGRGADVVQLYMQTLCDARVNLRLTVYLLDHPAFVNAVAAAAARGVKVRAILNAKELSEPLAWRKHENIETLLVETDADGDISGAAASAGIMHAKVIVADSIDFGCHHRAKKGTCTSGSMNLTKPGCSYNIENAKRTEAQSKDGSPVECDACGFEASDWAIDFDDLWVRFVAED